tara:strand:- start:2835 stop:3467 length:633 start_codon:yes stop_codon:yes gene_type:complete
MRRFDIINRLINKHSYKSYLEVGTQNPASNFNNVNCENKFCVEPNPTQFGDGYDWTEQIDFVGTSDEYFESIKDSDIEYDIIFIDGLHHNEQVLKDVENSLKHLSEGGSIVCHDCLPSEQKHSIRIDENGGKIPDGIWNGDVWKAIAELRINRSDLKIWTIDDDFGCSIIQQGESEKYIPKGDWNLWEYYNEHKYVMLNVVGTDHQVIKV